MDSLNIVQYLNRDLAARTFWTGYIWIEYFYIFLTTLWSSILLSRLRIVDFFKYCQQIWSLIITKDLMTKNCRFLGILFKVFIVKNAGGIEDFPKLFPKNIYKSWIYLNIYFKEVVNSWSGIVEFFKYFSRTIRPKITGF